MAPLLLLAWSSGLHGVRVVRKSASKPTEQGSMASEPTVQSLAAKYPANRNCALLSGFSVEKGCLSSAMDTIPWCSGGETQACKQTVAAGAGKQYTRDVRSSSQYDSLTSTLISVEGGGFGQSLSAGFSYLKRSEVTERSTSYFIGASRFTDAVQVKNHQKLKLFSGARDLLDADPDQFLAVYGAKYVWQVTNGGSFLGSFTLNIVETSDTRDFGFFAGIGVSYGVFSGGGSAAFESARSRAGSSVEVFHSADWRGGSGVVMNRSTPAAMQSMFTNWDSTLNAYPDPIVVQTSRWIDVDDVLIVILVKSNDVIDKFDVKAISPTMQERFSTEYGVLFRVKHAVDRALTWLATTKRWSVESCLNSLEQTVNNKIIEIQVMDDYQASAIQTQADNGNFGWFNAGVLNSQYNSCVAPALSVCNGVSAGCGDWQTLTKDSRVDWCLRSYRCNGEDTFPSWERIESTVKVAESKGKSGDALRDDLKGFYPGWEWAVVSFQLHRRRRWGVALRGHNIGMGDGQDRLLAMGTQCPRNPRCGTCGNEINCVKSKVRATDDMVKARDDALTCLGTQYTDWRNIATVKPSGGTITTSWYKWVSRTCFHSGVDKWYYIFQQAGAGSSVLNASSSMHFVVSGADAFSPNSNSPPLHEREEHPTPTGIFELADDPILDEEETSVGSLEWQE